LAIAEKSVVFGLASNNSLSKIIHININEIKRENF
jgi:hypothetical protein